TATRARKVLRSRKFLLADSLCHPAAAWVCVCIRIFGCSQPARAADWGAWVDPSHAFSERDSNATRLAKRRHAASADALLVRNLGQCIVGLLLAGGRAVARCSRLLTQRHPS